MIEQCRELLAAAARLCRAGRRKLPRRGAERAADRFGRALLSDHVLWRRGIAGTCATPTCSRRSEHLLEARGPQAKAIVWAHNSHIGDARYTDMGVVRGELNIGQLCRERFGDDAALIGFGTHTGTVAAATDWDGDMEVKRVRPSRRDSYERLCHDAGIPRFLLDLGRDEALRRRLLEPRLERFIGVIYRPETELLSHYSDAVAAAAVRRFRLVRRDHGGDAAGPEHANWRAGHLSVRAVAAMCCTTSVTAARQTCESPDSI